jgi:hypothetical protein
MNELVDPSNTLIDDPELPQKAWPNSAEIGIDSTDGHWQAAHCAFRLRIQGSRRPAL